MSQCESDKVTLCVGTRVCNVLVMYPRPSAQGLHFLSSHSRETGLSHHDLEGVSPKFVQPGALNF